MISVMSNFKGVCEECGWVDHKDLRWPSIQPEHRMALHKWAHHGHEFPFNAPPIQQRFHKEGSDAKSTEQTTRSDST